MKTILVQVLLFAGVFLLSDTLVAQGNEELAPCATPDQRSAWLRAYQAREAGQARNTDLLYVPLQVHIVGTDEGNGYFPYQRLLASFCTLNEDFAQANIRFYFHSPVNYINNSEYYDHDFRAGRRMMSEYNIDNVINCYIVEGAGGACGYYSPGVDGVALSKGCNSPNDHTWAHEIGHFLSLPHTFFGWEFTDETFDFNEPAPEFIEGWGVEKVDRSNCADAGDGFCDTPADYLADRWSCNSNSQSNLAQVDPDGVGFRSDGRYFMSYSNDGCMDRFSEEQIGAMRANLEEERPGHIAPRPRVDDILIPLTERVTPIYPTADDVLTTRSVTIEWEPVPNAEEYIVQLNPFNVFSVVFNEFIVDEPRVTFDALVSDDTYYWRVKPINNTDACHPWTRPNSFQTAAVVSSREEQLPAESVSIYPNPVTSGVFSLRIELGKAATGYWQLHNSQGKVVRNQEVQTDGFGQQQDINTAGLPAGMYWLRLVLDGKQLSKKIVLH
jgi:hypothetical protein